MTPDELYRKNFANIDWSVTIETYQAPKYRGPRSVFACPQIILDTMPPTQSMADGRVYDSKSAMSAATRRAGCIELGNEKIPPRQRPKVDRKEIKQTLEKAEARFNRGERASAT